MKLFLLTLCALMGRSLAQSNPNDHREPEVRLNRTDSSNLEVPIRSGYLEVLQRGKWVRVCDEGWGRAEEIVACGNLGFPDAAESLRDSRFILSIPYAHIGLMLVDCTGVESSLVDCVGVAVNGSHYCRSWRPVVLNCLSGEAKKDIRLRGGALLGEGRIQLSPDIEWGGVCGNQWSVTSANVACRQLGFGTARRAYKNAEFGQAHTFVLYTNVTCVGNEKSLSECPHETPQVSNYLNYTSPGCSLKMQAGVVCNVPQTYGKTRISLLNGHDESNGRVIVTMSTGERGSICSDNWGINEAMVVCRQLGLGYASKAYKNFTRVSRYGQPEEADQFNRIVVTDVRCTGDEPSLDKCRYAPPYRIGTWVFCGSRLVDTSSYNINSVGVACIDRLPDLQLDVPMLQHSISLDIKPVWRLVCAASENCLAPSAYPVKGNDNSTRSLLRFTVNVWNRGTDDFLPWQEPGQWDWHECHNHYHSMAEFAHYDILSTLTLQPVAEGHKVSFCLSDNQCDPDVRPAYTCTETPTRARQGISVSCSDVYYDHFDCQWIDITDINPGDYILRISLNPRNLVAELDTYNNHVMCTMTYNGTHASASSCVVVDDIVIDRQV